jgi:hypothetical protein
MEENIDSVGKGMHSLRPTLNAEVSATVAKVGLELDLVFAVLQNVYTLNTFQVFFSLKSLISTIKAKSAMHMH